jgi:hypothetical protein
MVWWLLFVQRPGTAESCADLLLLCFDDILPLLSFIEHAAAKMCARSHRSLGVSGRSKFDKLNTN